MKRKIIMLILIALCLLSSCTNPGTVNNAEVEYGNSILYNEAEINTAIETVLVKFKNFKGCDLIKLWYDEERSNAIIKQDMTSNGENTIKNSGATPENIMILFSEFYVDASGGDGSFNPDSVYNNWIWILLRNSADEKWKIADWGY